ncbi:hypothetical protein T484DRAFT_1829594, partial [Baffinella frigidus]
ANIADAFRSGDRDSLLQSLLDARRGTHAQVVARAALAEALAEAGVISDMDFRKRGVTRSSVRALAEQRRRSQGSSSQECSQEQSLTRSLEALQAVIQDGGGNPAGMRRALAGVRAGLRTAARGGGGGEAIVDGFARCFAAALQGLGTSPDAWARSSGWLAAFGEALAAEPACAGAAWRRVGALLKQHLRHLDAQQLSALASLSASLLSAQAASPREEEEGGGRGGAWGDVVMLLVRGDAGGQAAAIQFSTHFVSCAAIHFRTLQVSGGARAFAPPLPAEIESNLTLEGGVDYRSSNVGVVPSEMVHLLAFYSARSDALGGGAGVEKGEAGERRRLREALEGGVLAEVRRMAGRMPLDLFLRFELALATDGGADAAGPLPAL